MEYFKSFIYVCAASLILLSCTKREGTPELRPASENFQIIEPITIENRVVNFDRNQLAKFSGRFNEKVNWNLELTGLRSRAKRIIKKTSDVILPEEIIFDTRSSSIEFFVFERVEVRLNVLGKTAPVYIDTIDISTPSPLSESAAIMYNNRVTNGVKSVVIEDFIGLDPSFRKIDNLVTGASPDAGDVETIFRYDENIHINGLRSYYLSGRDINRNSWSGGMNSERLMDFYDRGTLESVLIDSGYTPDKVFFNVFLYGTGITSTAVQIKAYELDNKKGGKTEHVNNREEILRYANNANNSYDQTENDGWIFNIPVDWNGWRMVSIPYSQLQANQDPELGGNGNRIKEPWRLCGFGVSLLSIPEGNFNEVYIGKVILTYGGPFQR